MVTHYTYFKIENDQLIYYCTMKAPVCGLSLSKALDVGVATTWNCISIGKYSSIYATVPLDSYIIVCD